jgi:hypothetical protein
MAFVLLAVAIHTYAIGSVGVSIHTYAIVSAAAAIHTIACAAVVNSFYGLIEYRPPISVLLLLPTNRIYQLCV